MRVGFGRYTTEISKRHLGIAAAIVLIAIAIVRVVVTYSSTAQAFDEPCHVAAAMELLDRHTYTLDPVHPPLARIAIGIPLYVVGKRYPQLGAEEPAKPDYNVVGNHILYDDGHYLRNLILARSAMLPFLIGAAMLVFIWTRYYFGTLPAIISVLILTTTPIMLALSSIAYTDLVTATAQIAALFAFTHWLSSPSRRSVLILGAATGVALLSKSTSFLFLPAAGLAILVCRSLTSSDLIGVQRKIKWRDLAEAFAVAIVVLWAGYGFALGHLGHEMGVSATSMPSFQHFPGPIREFARYVALKDPLVPAPAFLHGVTMAWVLNKTPPPAYLFESIRSGGWWYFFLAGLAFKTPIPILLLCGVGLCTLPDSIRQKKWEHLVPMATVVAILAVTMPVKYNAGLRHILVVFPMLAVLAGQGAAFLLGTNGVARNWARMALLLLLSWQGFESIRSQSDFISYFNELAGRDPSHVLVAGCDLDCGQDLFRLSRELSARGVFHLSLAVWSSADMSKMGLPDFKVLTPFRPVTGWVAISARSLRLGEVLHQSYPPGAFSWLDSFHPIAEVGHTISLYYIPAEQLISQGSHSPKPNER